MLLPLQNNPVNWVQTYTIYLYNTLAHTFFDIMSCYRRNIAVESQRRRHRRVYFEREQADFFFFSSYKHHQTHTLFACFCRPEKMEA